jgi:hypothetical protein
MKELTVVLLIIVSLYCGLMPHKIHCDMFKKISSKKCPSQMSFIFLSGILYGLSILMAQEDYLIYILEYISGAVHTSKRIVLAGGNLVKNAAGNFESLSDFADTVESVAEVSTPI